MFLSHSSHASLDIWVNLSRTWFPHTVGKCVVPLPLYLKISKFLKRIKVQQRKDLHFTVVRCQCFLVFISRWTVFLHVPLFSVEIEIFSGANKTVSVIGSDHHYHNKWKKNQMRRKQKETFSFDMLMSKICWWAWHKVRSWLHPKYVEQMKVF